MPHHEDEARLLAGGMYLDLGMHNEAGAIFESVLTMDVPTGVRNRAWFYLANVWYARGYLDKAEEALRKINGRMSPDLEAQKELLFANVLMHQGRFDEAIQLLSGWRGAQPWSAYARFNLGVALVRAKRLGDADPFLSGVGTMLPVHHGARSAAGPRQPCPGVRLPAGGAAGARARASGSACA